MNATAARAAWAAAAKFFTDAFSDDIHINITVDAVTTPGTFGRSFPAFLSISYADLFDRVSAHASTRNDAIAIGPGGSMTATDPTNGLGTWQLTRAQAKALAFIPDDMSDDGGTTFGVGNSFTFSGQIAPQTFDFKGIAAHEISEVMGRLGLSGGNNSFSLIDNFSYAGAGLKVLSGGAGNFFSIDNGVTLLKAFNDSASNNLDTRDWAGGTNDAFNQFSNAGVANPVSAVDLQIMDVIGYGTVNPIGSLIETVGHITFLRAHELGSGFGKLPNFLDCEVIVLLAEEPLRAFGFKLRADPNGPARREMFDMLRSAFIAGRPIRLDYVTIGPRAGEIIRVANP
ncbi:MAG: NF038122 family metalloprotease [Acidobacteriota bacterium]